MHISWMVVFRWNWIFTRWGCGPSDCQYVSLDSSRSWSTPNPKKKKLKQINKHHTIDCIIAKQTKYLVMSKNLRGLLRPTTQLMRPTVIINPKIGIILCSYFTKNDVQCSDYSAGSARLSVLTIADNCETDIAFIKIN